MKIFHCNCTESCVFSLLQALAQKSDLEDRMMTLEKRYVRSQNDLSAAADDAEKLRAEIVSLQSITEQVAYCHAI